MPPFTVRNRRALERTARTFLGRRALAAKTDGGSRQPCDVVQGPSLLRTPVHRPSPSILSLPGLRSLPFWTSFDGDANRVAYQDPKLVPVVEFLESRVDVIQEEYRRTATALPSDYQDANDHSDSLHTGTWDWHTYMNKGTVQSEPFATHFPQTASTLQQLDTNLFEGTPFGFAFFSTLHPHSAIQPHTSPINFRLRVHLPLFLPTDGDCAIRVGPQTKRWHVGKALVLDDSYQHQVWNNTDEIRVLLLVDIWHPDVLDVEKAHIVNMFQEAKTLWQK